MTWRSVAASTEERGARPRVYLLTSHPVAPPWNGADKNLARMLLDADLGADFTFVGCSTDTTVWPAPHTRHVYHFRTDVPTMREKLRMLTWLSLHTVNVEVVHAIVTFKHSPITQWALIALPQIRQNRLIVTCPSGNYLPLHLLKRASIVVAVSRRTEQKLLQAGIEHVRRIAPGIDLEYFNPRLLEQCQSERSHGRQPSLLFAGHYDPGGGLQAALELAGRVRRTVPALKLLLAMRSRQGYRERHRKAEVREMVAKLGLADSIVELGPTADIRAALIACSAVVYQPAHLGMKMDLPMTLLEALACGRPLLISPVNTLPELADGSPAVLIEKPGGCAAVHHLERLLTDRAYASTCEAAARQLAERNYSMHSMLDAYSDLYSEVAGMRTTLFKPQRPTSALRDVGGPGSMRFRRPLRELQQ